jgi:phage tail-like protein
VIDAAPPTASERRYLRDSLPAVYRDPEDAFAMRFLQGLEELLDPIVAFLDALPAYLDLSLAPPDFVMQIGEWLGVDPEAQWRGLLGDDEVRRRELVGHATVIARRRGTAASLQLVLDLLFPDVELRVRDYGRSTFSAERRDPPAADASFEVVSAIEPSSGRRAAIDRVVEQLRPVHATYRGLRVEEGPA